MSQCTVIWSNYFSAVSVFQTSGCTSMIHTFTMMFHLSPFKCISFVHHLNGGFLKFIRLWYNPSAVNLLLGFLLMSTNVIQAHPESRLQNIVGQIQSLHAQLFNTEMPRVSEPPHYVGRTWHMAVFSMGMRTGYYRWCGENSYWFLTNTPTDRFSTRAS